MGIIRWRRINDHLALYSYISLVFAMNILIPERTLRLKQSSFKNQNKVRHHLDPCRIKHSCLWRYEDGEYRGVDRFTTLRVSDK